MPLSGFSRRETGLMDYPYRVQSQLFVQNTLHMLMMLDDSHFQSSNLSDKFSLWGIFISCSITDVSVRTYTSKCFSSIAEPQNMVGVILIDRKCTEFRLLSPTFNSVQQG